MRIIGRVCLVHPIGEWTFDLTLIERTTHNGKRWPTWKIKRTTTVERWDRVVWPYLPQTVKGVQPLGLLLVQLFVHIEKAGLIEGPRQANTNGTTKRLISFTIFQRIHRYWEPVQLRSRVAKLWLHCPLLNTRIVPGLRNGPPIFSGTKTNLIVDVRNVLINAFYSGIYNIVAFDGHTLDLVWCDPSELVERGNPIWHWL